MKKLKYIYTALFVALAHVGFSQVDNTMFFMSRLPQANLINPAQTPEMGIFISGLAVPLLGQLPPSMTFAVNTPLSWNDVIFKGKGAYKDSLISFMHPSYDTDKFTRKLKNNNAVRFNFELPIVYFGFRQAKNYWTFDFTIRENSYVNVPGDLLKFAIKGNANTRNADISGLGVNTTAYSQIAVGFQRELPLDFTMSARAKFLMGAVNISNGKTDLQINTEDGTNIISLIANYEIRTTLPVTTEYNDEGNIIFDTLFSFADGFKTKDFFGNYGGAIDLGVSKKIDDNISVFASVIDLGFINWRRNANTLSFTGDALKFEGAELSLDPFELLMPDLEELFKSYTITNSTKPYTTMLPFKIFAGGHYQLDEIFGFGLLGRLEKHPFGVSTSFTASADVRLFKFGNAALTYSYMNRNFTNIGIGYTLRVGPVQWYFVSDNLIGTLLFPSNSRSMSARFGCNLVFNRNEGEK
ncbi:MAG: DUF5723 family protein [Bacteroidetes bacterium]|nr:DUF5723 family protein [Bacteroidota bacterium]